MADAVDNAGGQQRGVDHLGGVHQQAPVAEQQHVDDGQSDDAVGGKGAVDVVLDPVVWHVGGELDQGFGVGRLLAVEEDTAEQDAPDALLDRAVRVFRALAEGVVLAVDGHPFVGSHAGCQPQPETHEMRQGGVYVDRPVRHGAVEEKGESRPG